MLEVLLAAGQACITELSVLYNDTIEEIVSFKGSENLMIEKTKAQYKWLGLELLLLLLNELISQTRGAISS